MMDRSRLVPLKSLVSAAIALLFLSCAASEDAKARQQAAPPTSVATGPKPNPSPGPRLSTRKLRVGSRQIEVEVADSEEERSRGLMYRERMDADSGMLFVFAIERPLTFWMKNTRIPLSIAFIGADMRINEIQDMVPAGDHELSPRVYASSFPAKFALEMNRGWFSKNGIKVGDTIELR